MKCPNCGKEIANDSMFCGYCGTKLLKTNPKKWLPWTIGGVAVVIIAVVVLLCIRESRYVDLGLPSGVKWRSVPESSYYTISKAKKKFGKRLPTNEDFSELIAKCTWVWVGNGYSVIGPNGNSIYMPAKGFINHNDNRKSEENEVGYYWAESNSIGNATYWVTINAEKYKLNNHVSYNNDYPVSFSVILVK